LTAAGRHLGWASASAAVLAAAAALAIAVHHPLGAAPALAAVLGAMGLSWRWPAAAFSGLLALLPVLGLAPWTGWLVVEEFDALLLAVAAGALMRAALAGGRGPATRWSLTGAVLFALLGVMVGVGIVRGVTDAGGWHFGWTQGLREPGNALRLGKVFFAALLGGALWSAVRRLQPGQVPSSLRDSHPVPAPVSPASLALLRGMALGLVGTALATLWERAAYTGVLNFSSDYRTTALFWEMHVGGAALDGYLALAMPFALLLALVARQRRDGVLAGIALVLGAYAALTTFSRIVYLAVPVALAVLAVLTVAQRARRQRELDAWTLWRRELLPALLLAAGFAAAAVMVFLHGGYRAVLALLGCAALLLPLAGAAARLSAAEWAGALALGGVAAVVALGGGVLLPKGPYVMHGLAVAAGAAALGWHLFGPHRAGGGAAVPAGPRGPAAPGAATAPAAPAAQPVPSMPPARAGLAVPLALAAFITAVATTGQVALHWGGPPALQQALPVLLLLPVLLVVAARRRGGLWPARLRWQALLFAALVAMAGLVGVLVGGAYFGDRVSSSRADVGVREAHWRKSLSLLRDDTQQWLGLGLGRYLDHYAVASNDRDRPGDYRHAVDGGNGHLALIAGTHVQGWGELLRVSQRIARPGEKMVLTLKVRSSLPVLLHADVCLKHLLYNDDCRLASTTVQPTGGQWQALKLALEPKPLAADAWYAPRFVVLSLSSETSARPIDIDEVSLTDASGREYVRNGGFEQGMQRWFFSSDMNHLPWHAKSLPVHLLVEQGILGLAAVALLVLAALWRLVAGKARDHVLAPALAAAVTGFLVVGLIDSLFDMPRVAWLFQFLLLVSFSLRGPGPLPPRPPPMPAAGRP
jgi:hypothetical protein